MTHLDAERLTLLALGERVDGASHLSHCDVCLLRMAHLREIVILAEDEEPVEAPPARTWRGVQGALRGPGGSSRRPGGGWLRPGAWVAAASVVAVAMVGAVLLTVAGQRTSSLIASGSLEPLAIEVASTAPVGAAHARVLEARDGLVLEVDAQELPPLADGYYEVWLLDAEATGLMSLGPLPAGGRMAVPAGWDLGAFPVVDVSVEHLDGDPTHSGDSVLRGELADVTTSGA
jgi:hypothetical protein